MKNIVIFLFVLVFLSCKENNISNKGYLGIMGNTGEYDLAYNEIDEVEKTEQGSPVERKLIKNGVLEYEVEDLTVTREKILTAVEQFKGYVSSDEESISSYRKSNEFLIRIPSKNFDAFLTETLKEAVAFDQKKITITDVTEQFLDVETRLKNKKALEERYLHILKSAKNVKEVLEVEKELGALREEIESAEGKLKYLQNQVSFSTIAVTIYKTIEEKDSFSVNILEGLGNGIDNVKFFLVFLVNIWPFILLLAILILWLKRRKRNNRKSKADSLQNQ